MLAAAADGVGGVLLVSGEQGIGKSALLAELLAGARDTGCRVCWAAGDELLERFPLRLIGECMGDEGRRVLAEERGGGGGLAGSVLSGDPVLAAAERLLVMVEEWCAASSVVLVAEDLQWADDASLEVWLRLAGLVDQMPLLMVGSFRPGPGGEKAEHLAGAVAAIGGTVVALGPLESADAAHIAEGLVGASVGRRLADVIEQAGGNPLYVRELVDTLVRDGRVAVAAGVAELAAEPLPAGVPVSLAAAIGERLEALSAEAAEALRWAAVLGQEFSLTELALVMGRSAAELALVVDQAHAAGVFAGACSRLAFRHGLIRQVVYQAMPGTVRAALHLEAARVLVQAGTSAERVAAQLAAAPEAGGEWVQQWLTGVAGELAYRAPQLTAELLRRVLAQMPEADPRREALESTLVAVAFVLIRDEEVDQVATRLLARTADPDRAAEVAWLLGYSMARTGSRTEAAAQVVAAALERPGVRQGHVARLGALHAQLLLAMGQPDQAAATAGKALADAEDAADHFAAGYASQALYLMAFWERDHTAMLDHAEKALAVIGDDPQTTDLRLLILYERADALLDLDRHDEASLTIRQMLAISEQVGTPRTVLFSLAAGWSSFDTGQWDDAVAVLDPAIGIPSQDTLMVMVRGLLAVIAAHRDDWGTAERHIAAVGEDQAQSARDPEGLYYLVAAQALVAERAGKPGQAAAALTQCLGRGVAAGPRRYLLLPSLARLALAAGDHGLAGAAARAAAKEADREPLPVKVAAAGHSRGLVEGDPGPVLEAAGYYQSAGRLPARAWALEDAAVLLAGRGEDAGARQAFTGAAREYLRLGAQWDLRRADARLRPYGIRRGRGGRRRGAARYGWQALTPTEAKIAALVAEGRSNPDIAAELFLSRNTVQTHVSHILAKLGARSRAEIARHALQQAVGSRPAHQP
jgi:DNA-binding CsgD family transcriptional regulator/tetratricopeptide (TPR) repeat protein